MWIFKALFKNSARRLTKAIDLLLCLFCILFISLPSTNLLAQTDNRCKSIVRSAATSANGPTITTWRRLDDSLREILKSHDNQTANRRMPDIAGTDLRKYWSDVGFDINWTRESDRPAIQFSGFENAGMALAQIRAKVASKLCVDISKVIEPRMIFYRLNRGQEALDLPLGAKIPNDAMPVRIQIMGGPDFYGFLAKRIFPVASPVNKNAIPEMPTVFLTGVEHDFGHLFGIFVGRPEVGEKFYEVGKAFMTLQSTVTKLHQWLARHPEVANKSFRLGLNEAAEDLQEGIENLRPRLFRAIESLYYVPAGIDFEALPYEIHPRQGFEALVSRISKLTRPQQYELVSQLKDKIPHWAVPIGGVTADLKYFFNHVNQLNSSDLFKMYRDFGLLSLFARTFFYFYHWNEIQDPKFMATFESDIARVLTLLNLSQGITPETWIQSTVITPMINMNQRLQNEMARLHQAVKARHENIEVDRSVFILPPVLKRDPIANFILTAPWLDREQVIKIYGLSDEMPEQP